MTTNPWLITAAIFVIGAAAAIAIVRAGERRPTPRNPLAKPIDREHWQYRLRPLSDTPTAIITLHGGPQAGETVRYDKPLEEIPGAIHYSSDDAIGTYRQQANRWVYTGNGNWTTDYEWETAL